MNATRKILGVLAAVGLMLGVANIATAQSAPMPVTVTIDENGNGLATYTDANGLIQNVPLPYFVGPDLGPGGLANALQYEWPLNAFVPGDLILLEPPQSDFSDIIRFNSAPGTVPINTIAFYSDLPEATESGPPDLADVGFPTVLSTNLVRMTEQGDETSWNGLKYTPGPNDPGYVPGYDLTYYITSDVPEPATLSLLALGGLALLRRRKA